MIRRYRTWLRRRIVGPAQEPRPVPDDRPVATYVGNNRVLVGTKVGPYTIAYLVEADDRLISPWFIVTGKFETPLTEHFLRHLKPDSHCLDIGANFGFFTCLMARCCPAGRVLGVEADRRIADLARDNLCINGLYGPGDILCAAASDNRDGVRLYRRTFRSGNTSIVDVGPGLTGELGEPPAEAFDVASVRIDDLAERMDGRIDVIKIDVEGAEPLVLAGAKETIRRNRDIMIVMEWSPGRIVAAGFDLHRFVREVASLGLCAFALVGDAVVPVEQGALAAMPYQAGIVLRRWDAVVGALNGRASVAAIS